MTKEELLKKNAVLEEKMQKLKDGEDRMRDVFSKILGSVKNNQWGEDTTIRLSWLEIAYEIGLKDVKNSNLVDANILNDLKRTMGELQQRIYKLERS